MNTHSLLQYISFSCSLTFLFLVGGFWNVIDHNEMITLSLFSMSYLIGTALGHRLYRSFESHRRFHLPFAYLGGALLGSGILILRYTIYYFELRALSPLLLIFFSSFLSAASGWVNTLLRPPKQPLDRPAYLICFLTFTFLPYFILSLSLTLGFQRTALLSSGFFLLSTAFLAALGHRNHRLRELGIHLVPALIILPMLWYLQKDLTRLPSGKEGLKVVQEVFGAHSKYVLAEEEAIGPLKVGLPQHTFYVDGVAKFSSESEQSENQCLVSFPVQLLQQFQMPPEKILIIGGGDGLAARNALQFPAVKSVKVLESEPSLFRLAREELKMRIYNLDSLKNPRTETVSRDIFWWVDHQEPQTFDLIVLDLLAPTEVNTMRLFSAEFLKRLLDLTSAEGAIVVRAGPLFLHHKRGVYSPALLEMSRTWKRLQQSPVLYSTASESNGFLLIFKDREKMVGIHSFKHLELRGASSCRIAPVLPETATASYTLNTLHLKSQFIDNIFSRGFSGERFVFLPN